MSVTWLSLLVLGIIADIVSGGQDHQHQGYFQYANVPAYGQYEFGYNRGNPQHYTSRYEQGNNWRFRTKVRWGDKKGGYGEHYWDYNHVDKGNKGWKENDNTGHGHGHQSVGHSSYGHQSHSHQTHGYGHQSLHSELNPTVIKIPQQAGPIVEIHPQPHV